MKYRIDVVLTGTVIRPSYQGYVHIFSNDSNPDFTELVYQQLRRTSFPEIMKDAVKIKDISVVGISVEKGG